MKKTTIIFSLAFFCLALTNCKPTNGIGVIQRQSLYSHNGTLQPTLFTIKTDATQRVGVIMADGKGGFKALLENSPDAALNAVATLAAKASLNGKDSAAVNAALTKTIDKLTNRTDAMQQQRDALFY